jgi:uncharacterized membrane protein
MITQNKVLMSQAREALKGKWRLAIGGFLLYGIIATISGALPGIGSIISLIVTGPLALGLAIFSLEISRSQEAKVAQIFAGFNHFVKALEAYILMVLFILLWSLLLIIPGIIAALSYSLVFYIIADDTSIHPLDALKKSKKMMYGYKWKYFCLGLRFIGWILLCILTLGIGFLWLAPYMQVTMAKFYDDVKNNHMEASEVTVVEEVPPETQKS